MSSEYTPAVVADLKAMVAASLPRWGLPPQTGIRLLNLSENATFLLSGTGGQTDLVLRVHRIGYSTDTEIRSELTWIETLIAEGVIETAAPVAGKDGEYLQVLPSPGGFTDRRAVAFARVPGKEPADGDDLPAWFQRLGMLTARLHGHAKRWKRPNFFRRKVWDFDAMVGAHAFWGPWRNGIGLDVRGQDVITQALGRIADKLSRYGQGPERFGLVHADLRLANLLVEGPHLRIIDFDDCGLSWFAYDFAASVSFIEHEAYLPRLLETWIAGYRSVAPLSEDDIAMQPSFVALRRILLTAWLASHREIPFAQEHGADFTAGTVAIAQAYLNGEFLAPAIEPFAATA